MSQPHESGDTTESSGDQSTSSLHDSAATTDISSVQSESEIQDSKTISDIHKSVATLPLPSHREIQKAPPHADIKPPIDVDPKQPSQETEPLLSLADQGKPETKQRAGSGPSEQCFDLTKLNRAVESLLESEYPRLLHNHRFDHRKIRARHPKEFDNLKFEGSPIKPGVLNVLSLVDVYF
ncbi:hypothetical protein BDD12DRAFT_808297 [Trichophaea hybrida]|nr:hypothetical protein BDD12DRAFT_808297 [Trichophaea hybrida]